MPRADSSLPRVRPCAARGVLAFTFWVEVFVGFMLLPWAILNGEALQLCKCPRDSDPRASTLTIIPR